MTMEENRLLRLLHVEDSPDDAELIRAELEAGGFRVEYRRVETAEELRRALNELNWDAVISDFSLPTLEAPAVLKIFRETAIDIPFIVVSGQVGEETAVELMRTGAHDYVMKDRLARLVPAIERELNEAGSRRVRKLAEEALLVNANLLREINAALGEGLLVFDCQGRAVLANPEAERLLGRSEEELKGNDLHEMVHSRKPDGSRYAVEECPIRNAIRQKQILCSDDDVFVRRDGSFFNVSYVATPLEGTGSAATVLVFKDITEQKRMDAELRNSRNQLRALSEFLQSVREDERTRIARELHDELGQMLTALKIDVGWLIRRLEGNQDAIPSKLDAMDNMLDKTVDAVRRISSDLRPWILDDLGLAAAMEWLAEQFSLRNGVECTLSVGDDDDLDLDSRIATTIFRIVQEALTNVSRHAEAQHVQVNVRRTDGHVVVQISDDGRGFDPVEAASRKRFGLLGIRERVEMLDGYVEFSSSPGAGTTVHVTLPIQIESQEAQ